MYTGNWFLIIKSRWSGDFIIKKIIAKPPPKIIIFWFLPARPLIPIMADVFFEIISILIDLKNFQFNVLTALQKGNKNID